MNEYFSGQGSLYAAKRDAATGRPLGFMAIGNVPELTIDIEISKFEHKESESGSRLLDLTIVKERKGKFKFKAENLNAENMAIGFYGESSTVAGGSISVTPDTLYIPKVGAAGMRFPLMHPKVTVVVVKSDDGITTYDNGDDYLVDSVNGIITIVAGGAIATAATAAVGQFLPIDVTYTYAGYTNLEAFTQSVSPERWLRFEGLNTVDGSSVVIDMYRAQFDPLTGYSLINDELASIDLAGSLLADPFVTTGSKFFRKRAIAA